MVCIWGFFLFMIEFFVFYSKPSVVVSEALMRVLEVDSKFGEVNLIMEM